MADVIRWSTKVTPVEECDEGFKHIHSSVGKSLGGSGSVDVTTLKYNGSYTVSAAAASAHQPITGGDPNVELLYIKNTGKNSSGETSDGVVMGAWQNATIDNNDDAIIILFSGESILVHPARNNLYPTPSQVYVWLYSGDAVEIEILADAP